MNSMRTLLLAGVAGTLLMAFPTAWPAPKAGNQGGIAFISGGVGEDDEEAMRKVVGDYNLRLGFAIKGSGAYLADVKVLVRAKNGGEMLRTVSQGPCFFARLAPGRYVVDVETLGVLQSKPIQIREKAPVNAYFYWEGPSPASSALQPRAIRVAQHPEDDAGGHGIHGCW